MNKNEGKKRVSVVGRMLLAYALVFAQGAWAGQNQATKDQQNSPQKAAAQQTNGQQSSALATAAKAQTKQAQGEESESAVAEEKPSGDGRHEGIKVHGHWTIEVRNPDGSLVTHRELENSLHSPNVLSVLLSGQAVAGPWSVFIGANPSNSAQDPCPPSSYATSVISPGTLYTAACIITQQNSLIYEESITAPTAGTAAAQAVFGTLKVSLLNTAYAQQQIQLTGTAQAQSSGVIEQVSSYQEFCQGNVTANGCIFSTVSGVGNFSGGFDLLFTQAPVSPSLSVVAGQTIAVTVNISFS